MTTAALMCLFATSGTFIQVKVDPRVELITGMFRVAGAGEFNMSSADSPYSRRLDAWLTPHRNHPAIKMVDRLREQRQIGFDGVAWLAVHIDGINGPKLLPNRHAADWDNRWKPDELKRFLSLTKDFVRDSNFEKFLQSERAFYAKATVSLQNLLQKRPVGAWLENFFGQPPSEASYVIVGLLCGGGNYGVSFRDRNEVIVANPILGAANFDQAGFPIYGESDLGLILHELSHPYVNHVVARVPGISDLGKPLYDLSREALNANAYHGAEVTMFETFTRAAENIMLQRFAPDLARDNMVRHRAKGFLWQSDVTEALSATSKPGIPFAERVHRVVPVLKRLSNKPQVLLSRCPQVTNFVVTEPDESRVVDIHIEFDRPINKASRGLSISSSEYEVLKRTTFDDAGQSLTLTVKFKKPDVYTLQVNSNGSGYLGANGYPVRAARRRITIR